MSLTFSNRLADSGDGRKMAAMPFTNFSRRSFLAMSAALPWALRAFAADSKIPVGLELYSVRDEMKKDPEGTVRVVAQMGFECVEFYAPYFEWSQAQARHMRKRMDDLGIKCYSTHNDEDYFSTEKISRARDLNLILGTRYMVMASSATKTDLAGWQVLAEKLNAAGDQLEASGLTVGYHNHDVEWRAIEGKRPMEVLAANTKPSVMLQLDVGTCVAAGADPVGWIRANPGRIQSIHCKDWSPDPGVGYKTLFGEGKADWKGIFRAAESVGGVEFYLIEQEGSRYPEIETVRRCLQNFHSAHAGRHLAG